MTKGPIIIIEDDKDDQHIYAEIINELQIPNPLRFFNHGLDALNYLLTTPEQPFIILSDINMPIMNGIELKEKIQADDFLKKKGIPFLFISTNASPDAVRKAHLLSVQGYFMKPVSYGAVRAMLTRIFDYWEHCKHVNNIS